MWLRLAEHHTHCRYTMQLLCEQINERKCLQQQQQNERRKKFSHLDEWASAYFKLKEVDKVREREREQIPFVNQTVSILEIPSKYGQCMGIVANGMYCIESVRNGCQ